MDLPYRWGWLTRRRIVRLGVPLAALVVLLVVLYNATLVDRVPPSISLKVSLPAPGNLVYTGSTVDVEFSEDVDRPSAEAAFSITPPVPGSFHWRGRSELIFTPSAKLPLSTTYQVHMLPGTKDLAGNADPNGKKMTFTTVGPPAVATVVPAAGTQDVPVDAKIVVTFDRLMVTDSVAAALRITPAVSYTVAWSQQVLTIQPKSLDFATTYRLSIGGTATDTDGTHLAPYETSFTTIGIGLHALKEIPTPNVAGVSIGSPIAIVFDGPIDPASVGSSFAITPPVGGDVRVTRLRDDRTPPANQAVPTGLAGNVLLFTPGQPLAPHTTYTVTLNPGVKRTDGEAAATVAPWTFTTGEAPTTAQNQIVFVSDRAGVANLWLMNPDGSNQREITSELVPVSGFDISADGSKVTWGAGGVVKRMAIGGGDLQTLTPDDRYEYSPSFTPDGSAIVLGRRDRNGADQGYWRISLQGAGGEKQMVDNGAPGIGSVTLTGAGLTASTGRPSWASRAAFSTDGKVLLLVRGDGSVMIVDMTGATPPTSLSLVATGLPVWLDTEGAFYVVASSDGGASWQYWRITRDGVATQLGPATGELAVRRDGNVAVLMPNAGDVHVGYGTGSGITAVTNDASWSDRSPSFSPDGSSIVFSRVAAEDPTRSAGIWKVGTDGNGLTELATDGAYPRWLP